MPPVPSHQLSWQGSPVMVDFHGQQQPRMRVASHTNEYVGSLRAKEAPLLGASAKRVRMLYAGERRGAAGAAQLRHAPNANARARPAPRSGVAITCCAARSPTGAPLSPARYAPALAVAPHLGLEALFRKPWGPQPGAPAPPAPQIPLSKTQARSSTTTL